MTLTQRAIEILNKKMAREWAAHCTAKAGGYAADAAMILEAYNATGFRLAKIRIERLRVNG